MAHFRPFYVYKHRRSQHTILLKLTYAQIIVLTIGQIRVDSKLSNSVHSAGIGQRIDENQVILCPCICAAMRYRQEAKSLMVQAFSTWHIYVSPWGSMTSDCSRVMISSSSGNVTLVKWSSSFTHFAKKPVREVFENVRLFSTVNDAGIINSYRELF